MCHDCHTEHPPKIIMIKFNPRRRKDTPNRPRKAQKRYEFNRFYNILHLVSVLFDVVLLLCVCICVRITFKSMLFVLLRYFGLGEV